MGAEKETRQTACDRDRTRTEHGRREECTRNNKVCTREHLGGTSSLGAVARDMSEQNVSLQRPETDWKHAPLATAGVARPLLGLRALSADVADAVAVVALGALDTVAAHVADTAAGVAGFSAARERVGEASAASSSAESASTSSATNMHVSIRGRVWNEGTRERGVVFEC